MKYLGSQERETNRLVLKPQTMEEQKYLWEVLMIPEVNRYFLTVPPKLRDKQENVSEDYLVKKMGKELKTLVFEMLDG